jgi:uncharacterized protein YndB with AHSA1/START domain
MTDNASATRITVDSDTSTLILERTFAAPRELVFDVFTQPEHLKQWFAPRPWVLAVCDLDLRPGGTWRYKMEGPDGEASWGKSVYHTVERPSLLVYTDAFTDADGNIMAEMPMFQITAEFTEHDGHTTITSRSVLPSAEAIEMLMSGGMEEGIRATWDVLDEYLTGLVAAR